MKTNNFARIMIAGTGSGCGKTTVACGVLKALINRGMKTAAFKCGPDYIDPMFHSKIVGTKSRNLDTFLCGEEAVKYLFAKNGESCDISVIEGVMGFYDGHGNDGSHSSHAISQLTKTPVILVVNPHGMALSMAALIKGFKDFMPNNIKGVIINNVTPASYTMYRHMLEKHTDIKVCGFLPPLPEAAIESRHLGLVTADEISDIQAKLERIAENAEKSIDIDRIIELAQEAPAIKKNRPFEIKNKWDCSIAVAKDRAFCFYYEDSLELLEQLGARLTYFSPLRDKKLPEDASGLILGGGYPELYAARLSQNKNMLESIKTAVENGMPTYAECGGFMYLQQALTDMQGNRYPMAGAIKGNSMMQGKLTRFGYAALVAKEDNLFCLKGEKINAHEFHYSDSDNNGASFEAQNLNGVKKWDCIFANDTIAAGYPHVHLYGNVSFAERLVQKCSEYKHPVNT